MDIIFSTRTGWYFIELIPAYSRRSHFKIEAVYLSSTVLDQNWWYEWKVKLFNISITHFFKLRLSNVCWWLLCASRFWQKVWNIVSPIVLGPTYIKISKSKTKTLWIKQSGLTAKSYIMTNAWFRLLCSFKIKVDFTVSLIL